MSYTEKFTKDKLKDMSQEEMQQMIDIYSSPTTQILSRKLFGIDRKKVVSIVREELSSRLIEDMLLSDKP